MTPPLSKCRGCKATIVWAKTERGRNIPIDPAPVPDGNIVLTAGGVAHVLQHGEEATGLTYVSHFSTCPQSKTFSRRRTA